MGVTKWDVARDAQVELAEKAKESGKWIFEKSTNNWYNPTEFAFLRDVSIRVPKRTAITSNYVLIDPRDYIKARQDRIVQHMEEIKTMEKRLFDYYKLEPKK